MNYGTFFALLIILVALAAGVLLGGTDVSSPTLAMNELRNGAPGPASASVIFNQLVGVLLGIVLTGTVAGVAGVVFMAARDWWEDRQKGEWEPGPNAGFKRRGQRPAQPGFSRDDLMTLAVLNMLSRQGGQQGYLPQIQNGNTQQDDGSDNF